MIHVFSSDLSGDALEPERSVQVTSGGQPLENLNDLQWVNGEIWANIWRQERLAVINPQSGAVRCFVDLSGLPLGAAERRKLGYEEVLNGLAHDTHRGTLLVT